MCWSFRTNGSAPRSWWRSVVTLAPSKPSTTRMEDIPTTRRFVTPGNADGRRISFSPNTADGELEWHSDHIHLPTPARASLLYATKVPDHGGDTYFACMYHAYDALSPKQKVGYESLTLVNSVTGLSDYLHEHGEYSVESLGVTPGEVYGRWPLVRHHPRTGRAALYFGSHVTIEVEGWSHREAMQLVPGTHDSQHPCGILLSASLARQRCYFVGQPGRVTRRGLLRYRPRAAAHDAHYGQGRLSGALILFMNDKQTPDSPSS